MKSLTLKDIDWKTCNVFQVDGKAVPPAWVPHRYSGKELGAKFENANTYHGSCHCGAVKAALETHGALKDGKEQIQEWDNDDPITVSPSSPRRLSGLANCCVEGSPLYRGQFKPSRIRGRLLSYLIHNSR